MNPRRPYRPDRRSDDFSIIAGTLFAMLLVLIGIGGLLALNSVSANPTTPQPTGTRAAVAVITLAATATAPAVVSPSATPALATPMPVTEIPATPTPAAAPTLFYTTQAGDTLPALAARFGISTTDIVAPNGLVGTTTLAEGQLLILPKKDLGELTPAERLFPDSEMVLSGAAAGFDPETYANEQGGYLARYKLFADERTRDGGDVILLVGQHHSLNPRLLTALLEYESGWVTNPEPTGDALIYPMGYVHPYRQHLYTQMYWASTQLSIGYYGWRTGELTYLTFNDGSTLRLDPTLNAGTVALMYYFAQVHTRAEWEHEISPAGFAATYLRMFGDPATRMMEALIPADLTQPPLQLPFLPEHTWYFSGGPHGAWLHGGGGAMAALDFAPGSVVGGCAESGEWVTAVAAGIIVRVDNGSVLLDLDGDGREATGWVILYLHIGPKDRVQIGTVVEAGDRLGHPSCEGGQSTGTHVHLARKYNGEWIPADGQIPFNLSGWVAARGTAEYLGTLTRGAQVVSACTCTSAATALTADPAP